MKIAVTQSIPPSSSFWLMLTWLAYIPPHSTPNHFTPSSSVHSFRFWFYNICMVSSEWREIEIMFSTSSQALRSYFSLSLCLNPAPATYSDSSWQVNAIFIIFLFNRQRIFFFLLGSKWIFIVSGKIAFNLTDGTRFSFLFHWKVEKKSVVLVFFYCVEGERFVMPHTKFLIGNG